MDDIVILENDQKRFQTALNILEAFRVQHNMIYSKKKTKIMIMNKPKNLTEDFNIGTLIPEHINEYQYLGELINNKKSYKDNIKSRAEKTQIGVLQIKTLAKDQILSKIKTFTLINLYNMCIKPRLLYATETWNMNEYEMKELEKIQNKALKAILNLPKGTPTSSIQIDTGLLSIRAEIEKRTLNYFYKIKNMKEGRWPKRMIGKQNKWMENANQLMQKYEINEHNTIMTKLTWKNIIKKGVEQYEVRRINTEIQQMQKVNNRTPINQIKIQRYIQQLTYNETTTILKARARMLPFKSNMHI